MILPLLTAQWPADWLDRLQERASIMADSGVPDAEQRAEADIRRVAADEGQVEMFAPAGDTQADAARHLSSPAGMPLHIPALDAL